MVLRVIKGKPTKNKITPDHIRDKGFTQTLHPLNSQNLSKIIKFFVVFPKSFCKYIF